MQFLRQLGPAVIGLVYLGLRWRAAETAERNTIAVFALGLAVYLPLALGSVRWASYVQALILAPWTLAIIAVSGWGASSTAVLFRPASLRTAAAVLAVFGPMLSAKMIAIAHSGSVQPRPGCNWSAMIDHLGRNHWRAPDEDIVLSYMYLGPRIIWHTPYRVVGAPYGNATVIEDTRRVFAATSERAARAVIERRGVDLVLVCKYSHKNDLYIGPNDEGLLASLLREQAPPWLEEVPLPARLSTMFRLFRFDPAGSGGRASRRPREAE